MADRRVFFLFLQGTVQPSSFSTETNSYKHITVHYSLGVQPKGNYNSKIATKKYIFNATQCHLKFLKYDQNTGSNTK